MQPRKAKPKIEGEKREKEREREGEGRERVILNLSIKVVGMDTELGDARGRERKEESKRWRKSTDKELCM